MYYLCIIKCKLNVALKLLLQFDNCFFTVSFMREYVNWEQNKEVICEYVIILMI